MVLCSYTELTGCDSDTCLGAGNTVHPSADCYAYPNFPISPQAQTPSNKPNIQPIKCQPSGGWRWKPYPIKQDYSSRFSGIPALGPAISPEWLFTTSSCNNYNEITFTPRWSSLTPLPLSMLERETDPTRVSLGTPRSQTHQT